ncbi:MAG: hypothetical protein HUU06_12490 [Planctomycetaceae bacterium]|nr:hypothetical protein [Planctomycetota bacterium]NUN53587.1 hypothetical protein [Planctomycetaceae bacterium]
MDPEEEPVLDVRPIDRRRIKEIRQWLDGTREDAPTEKELREFLDWVYAEIEWSLARHQPTTELLACLNAAREELARAAAPPAP